MFLAFEGVRLVLTLTYHTRFSSLQTFRNRLVEVIDQAQHFAALGPAGGGGQSGDAALTFREGLEMNERERESLRFALPLRGRDTKDCSLWKSVYACAGECKEDEAVVRIYG